MARCPTICALVAGLTLSVCSSGPALRADRPPVRAPDRETPAPEAPPAPGLFVSPSASDFSQNPRLLERIVASPHGYFRFINATFADAVCAQFQDDLDEMPTMNLHGDAHLEQYAVTDLGRGLTDFDDSASGPAVLDLMRILTSMRLAARELGWDDDGQAMVADLLRGYHEALEDPEVLPEEPAYARRVRAGFHRDRGRYLGWAESLMRPLDDPMRAELTREAQPYFETMRAQHPELNASFFHLKSLGRLQMGIGSALDEKYLLRVEGLTAAAEDDLILEVKELRDLSGIRCIRGERRQDPFRILVGQSRIAYVPYPYLGYARVRGRMFWVHGWVDNYKELAIADRPGHDELCEIAHDIGVQLGRGHPKQIATPLDLQLRRAQAAVVSRLRGRMERLSRELADQVVVAWERFRREAPRLGTTPPR